MRKFNFLALVMSLCVSTCIYASDSANHSHLLTVLNPDKWGLDTTISGVIAALSAFLIGLLINPKKKNKK